MCLKRGGAIVESRESRVESEISRVASRESLGLTSFKTPKKD